MLMFCIILLFLFAGRQAICFQDGFKTRVLNCPFWLYTAPLAHEPFSTLAMIYEDQGDMEKSLQFELIAAHLNPSDTEEWVRLAEMSLEQDNIKQAVFCYTKGSVATI